MGSLKAIITIYLVNESYTHMWTCIICSYQFFDDATFVIDTSLVLLGSFLFLTNESAAQTIAELLQRVYDEIQYD